MAATTADPPKTSAIATGSRKIAPSTPENPPPQAGRQSDRQKIAAHRQGLAARCRCSPKP
jgi:hypothetical protein